MRRLAAGGGDDFRDGRLASFAASGARAPAAETRSRLLLMRIIPASDFFIFVRPVMPDQSNHSPAYMTSVIATLAPPLSARPSETHSTPCRALVVCMDVCMNFFIYIYIYISSMYLSDSSELL